MNLGIIHVSDVHVHNVNDPVLDRVESICSAIESAANDADTLLFVCSGDVAFAGKQSQYDRALEFFNSLRLGIERRLSQTRVLGFVVVPGNHDCDFATSSDARRLFIDSGAKGIQTLDIQGDVIQHCLAVQSSFWSFASKLEGISIDPALFRQIVFEQGRHKIVINTYNTALLSTIHEKQGQLLFPPQGVPPDLALIGSVSISVFHHPYNWLEAANAAQFRRAVEGTSDVILSGHEHESDGYTKSRPDGQISQFIEAPALSSGTSSAYNVIMFDLEHGEYSVSSCSWNGSTYTVRRESKQRFIRSSALNRTRLTLRDDFRAYLNEPGAGFTHPMKEELTLNDLFVFPDLKRTPLDSTTGSSGSPNDIRSSDILLVIQNEPKILITGPDQCGKTTLAKTLFSELAEAHVPVLLGGDGIKARRAVEGDAFREIVEQTFVEQFGAGIPDFWLIEKSRRVLIVDDLHKARLSLKGQSALLIAAEHIFGKVICFANDVSRIETITEGGGSAHPFRDYANLEIQEFGHYLRGKLIAKWIRLGRELDADETQIQHEITAAEHTINTLIGNNILPSFPIIVLTCLQGQEASRVNHAASGSYGQLYELLITDALGPLIRKPSDLDTKYTYLSRVAHFMFVNSRKSLTLDDIQKVNDAYYREYAIQLELGKTLEDLVSVGVFKMTNGAFGFKYNYYYYYFVAKWFQQNLGGGESTETREMLKRVANRIYYHEHAHILLFYIYLTKDKELIEYVMEKAREIFADHNPCDFADNVEFVNKLYKEAAKLILPPKPYEAARDEERQRRDSSGPVMRQEADDAEVVYKKDLGNITKAHIAFATLQVMGQVLRNFPGSLRAELKERIASESYAVGLRTLRAILSVAEENKEEVRTYLAELIREHRPPQTELEVAKSADEVLIALTEACAFGMVKRIAQAVGIEELRKTYRDILDTSAGNLSVSMIDVAIRLDHFTDYPADEVEKLAKRVRKNFFANNVLRNLVAYHMYLFPVEYKTRQKIGDLMNIESGHPKMLDNPQKRKQRSSN